MKTLASKRRHTQQRRVWRTILPAAGHCLLVAFGVLRASAGPVQLVSCADALQSSPAGGGGESWSPILSADGRFVLFASAANNLVPFDLTNPMPALAPPKFNVFLRDRASATTALVSVNLGGSGGGNGDSWPVTVSTNGRYALFESSANDLVTGDTNNAADVFVRDLVGGVTLLVSVATNGGIADEASGSSAMTSDGRFVAFASRAGNLVTGDTNHIQDVFVRDLRSNVTTLVSVGAKSGTSDAPDITPDGRCVAFYSTAPSLVPGQPAVNDVFLRDLTAGTTTWVSAGARTAVRTVLGALTAVSYNHALSTDGQFVAFEASAGSIGLILRYSVASGTTQIIYTNAAVPSTLYENVHSLEMTPDGRFVTFIANANGTVGTTTCVLLWDAQTATNVLVSGDLSNAVAAGSTCNWPTLDDAGRFVAFLSNETNMVTNVLSGDWHIYVRDTQTGTTRLAATGPDGSGPPLSLATVPRLSADGCFLAFESSDDSLVPGDRNHHSDVFVRDLTAQTTELISVRDAALPSLTANGPSTFSWFAVSGDGRYIAFSSTADNLVAGDTNGLSDVFLRDVQAGTNVLISSSVNSGAANGDSVGGTISSDGRYVAFSSGAANLVPGDTNNAQDVFVRDLQTGTNLLASVSTNGVSPGNANSHSSAISADGRYVMFRSKASNLTPSTTDEKENLFLRDLEAGTNYSITTAGFSFANMTADGRYIVWGAATTSGGTTTNLNVWDSTAAQQVYMVSRTGISRGSISPDGRYVAFAAAGSVAVQDRFTNTNKTLGTFTFSPGTGLRFSADSRLLAYATTSANDASDNNGVSDVYVCDLQAGTNLLVSRSCTFQDATSGVSDSPDLSPDGRYVAYRSAATEIVPDDTNGQTDLFLYDRVSRTTILLSANMCANATGNNASMTPVFWPNGQGLLFASLASDLVAQDCNSSNDTLAYSISSAGALLPFYVQIRPGSPATTGMWLSWPVVPGRTYRAQFKNALEQTGWQTLNLVPAIIGNQGHLGVASGSTPESFYRIVGF